MLCVSFDCRTSIILKKLLLTGRNFIKTVGGGVDRSMEEESPDETIYREVGDMWFNDLRPVLEN
jgi:hypothetical protein